MTRAHRLTFIDQGDALNPIRLRAALARTKRTP